tara:strand:+ start:65 stop:871 length:807 start_codon:yes stop_codon:yes gene_type:complete
MLRNNQKRGQISIFIIIGLILIILVAFIFFYLSSIRTTSGKETSENQHIIGFIEGCIDQKAKQGLFYLGFVGGGNTLIQDPTNQDLYIDPFKGYYYSYDDYYKIPYHYYLDDNKEEVLIEQGKVKQILEEFINDNLGSCINNFENFDEAEFVQGDIDTIVYLKDEAVVFNVDFPIIMKTKEEEKEINPLFTAHIPVRLKIIDEISLEIVEKAQQDPTIIDWEYLTELGEKGFNATAYTGFDTTIIYRIIDTKYKIDNQPYVYQFAVKI